MSMSTFPIGFPESAEQSLCPELSDELAMALAAGEWWAIMEVSSPISEEPEYRYLTSGLWWGTVEAVETPCPTSLKSTKQWRQNKTQGAPVAAESPEKAPVPTGFPQGPPVPKSQDWRKLNFSEPLKQERLQQQKPQSPSLQGTLPAESPQKAPVPTRFPQGPPVPKSQDWRKLNFSEPLKQERLQQQKPQSPSLQGTLPAESPQKAPVPTGFPQGPPVPKSQDWRKLNFSEPLKQERLQQQKPQSPSLQGTLPAESPQKAPLPTGFPQGPPVPKSQDWRKLNFPEPLKQERLQQQKPQNPSLQGTLPAESPQKAPVPKSQDWRKLNFSEPLKQERLQQQKPQSPSLQGTLPDKISKRPRLKIPEPLRGKLLQQRPQASPPQGAPLPARSKKGGLASALFFTNASEKDLNSDATLKTTEQQRNWRPKKPQEAPVAAESPQKAPVATGFPQGPPVPKSQDWRKLNFSEPLKQERLQQQKPQNPSLQGTLPDNISKRPRLEIPEPLRGELLQQRAQASSPQGAPIPDKTSKREKLEVPEPLRRELLQQRPQASSIQGAPVPDTVNVGVFQSPPQNKICVEIDEKVQLNPKLRSQNQICTSHLDQSSRQPRSQLNRKRALDNAGVDQSPPQKCSAWQSKPRTSSWNQAA